MIPGLSEGHYRLVASNLGFQVEEIPVTVRLGEAPDPVRITLKLGSLSTTVEVQGREDDLSGVADSGTQGTVGAKEIQDRPVLRSGEVLEVIPGVIITQHAGGGKANQYFLRGFNLDHGTDFAISIDGMLSSHAHGEGYADMNTVIPELVQRVNYEKAPYYADVGNYSSAGSAHLQFFKTLPKSFVQVEGGMYGYGRMVFGASHKLGAGDLLYGGEAYRDDGPWMHPDNYYKFNGLLTYSQANDSAGFSITARGYHGRWHSSDQIPVDAVPLVGLFGTLNPTDGGHSQRQSLQGDWHRQGGRSQTEVAAYGFYYDLDLFSDFTYSLTDPRRGDQFEQYDRRWVAGINARPTIDSEWFGRNVENTFGLQALHFKPAGTVLWAARPDFRRVLSLQIYRNGERGGRLYILAELARLGRVPEPVEPPRPRHRLRLCVTHHANGEASVHRRLSPCRAVPGAPLVAEDLLTIKAFAF